jgi:hypothetical protein
LRSTVLPGGKIAERDLSLFTVTDDPAEAVRIVLSADAGLGGLPDDERRPEPDDEAAHKGAE